MGWQTEGDALTSGRADTVLYTTCMVINFLFHCTRECVLVLVSVLFISVAGWTPLMYAAYVGHDTVVNLLLDSDANPSLGTPGNLTPLMVAAGCGNESVCYFLIQVS